mmetsp:Transcript_16995/g.55359  ORF Transcript_16995/g.55359 Transcript_16995/m.55359 type:complete len:354 (-) Transcript_16995:104-1165(-)
MAHHAPEGMQEVGDMRIDPELPIRRGVDQPIANHGQHARHGEVPERRLGQVEDQKRHGDGDDYFDVCVLVRGGIQLEPPYREKAERRAEQRTEDGEAEGGPQYKPARLTLVIEPGHQRSGVDRLDEDGKDDHSSAVVEEGLGLDECGQRLLDAHLAQESHHRDWIGGGEDSTEEHGGLPWPFRVEAYICESGQDCCDDKSWHGEEERVAPDLGEDVPVDREGRLEQQRREEQVQQQVGVDAGQLAQRVAEVVAVMVEVVWDECGDVASEHCVTPRVVAGAHARLQREGWVEHSPGAEQCAEHQEQDRVRQRHPLEELLGRRADQQAERQPKEHQLVVLAGGVGASADGRISVA